MKNNQKEKSKCQESCQCVSEKAFNPKIEEETKDIVSEKEKNDLDPTHFGDWQVNCRTIDF